MFLVLRCINVIDDDDFKVIDKGKNTFVQVSPNLSPSIKFKLQGYQMCEDKWDIFLNIFEYKRFLFKIPNHFLRNPFVNFDSYMNLNPSYVMEGKKKKKKMSLKELKEVYVHDEMIALWK